MADDILRRIRRARPIATPDIKELVRQEVEAILNSGDTVVHVDNVRGIEDIEVSTDQVKGLVELIEAMMTRLRITVGG